MRPGARIRTPEERAAMRSRGDDAARVSQVQLLCIVSILRTGLTRVLPLCASAGWWVLPLCLLPGLCLYALGCLCLKRRNAATLGEAARSLPGKGALLLLSGTLAALLLLEGAAGVTTLVTMFTQGIGTEGTQVTLALLTLAALLLCMQRDALAWGVWLLHRPMALTGLIMAAVTLFHARWDGLHPILGSGRDAVAEALAAGASLGWPLVLLLTVKPHRPGRIRPVLPCTGAAAMAGLLVCVTLPGGLRYADGLAAGLLQPGLFLPPALRTLSHCLMMLGLFLASASSARLGADQLLLPTGRMLWWLPGIFAGAMTATQLLPIHGLWQWLNDALLLLPCGMGAILIIMTLWRRPCSGK